MKGCVCESFFYPSREKLKKLIVTVNRQKDILKKNGVVVDGKRYAVDFKGTCETSKTKIVTNLKSYSVFFT